MSSDRHSLIDFEPDSRRFACKFVSGFPSPYCCFAVVPESNSPPTIPNWGWSLSPERYLEGQPLSGGSIYFESDDKTYSASNIDSSGQYSLRFNSEKMGVTPGPKTVRIRTQAMPTEVGGSEEDPDAKPKAVVSTGVPDCYDKASPIRVTVDASSSQFDFDLKKDCSTKLAK